MRTFSKLSDWSLRKKLVFLIMLSSTICLIVSFSVLFASSLGSSHKESLQQLSGISDILAENVQASLVFDDRGEAQRLLDALKEHHEIESAWLLDSNGRALAAWNRHGKVKQVPADYKVNVKQTRSELWSKYADLYRPVIRDKERIGYILLQADLSEVWDSHVDDFETGLVVAALSLLVIYILAIRLQRLISQPIKDLSEAAR